MSTNVRKWITGAVAAVVLATALSACSPADSTPSPVPTQSSSTTPTPGETTAPTAEPTADPTPIVEATEYAMADGTTVAVDPSQPLPAAVLADIAAPVDAAVAKIIPNDTTDYSGAEHPVVAATSAASRSAALAAQQTHRQVIIIYRVWGAPNGDDYGWVWGATRGAGKQGIADKAARVAEVQAYIAASANPAEYDLIVLE